MKNRLSFIACVLVGLVMLQYRIVNSDLHLGQPPLKVTVWDAFGYYVYLPSLFIYHDCGELKWLDSIDKKYAVTGGDGYQAQKADNGKYVFKYLGGVAILEIPFFAAGHLIAKLTHYPPDGFSPPYQYALGFGIIFYCFAALLLLRRILLYYFSDLATAITLLSICLATNFLQYAAVDNGQSHAYIFALYVLVLYTTIRWHRKPAAGWAIATGYIIGLATMSRPTEAIMLFIPLMWDTAVRDAARAKWEKVRAHKQHIAMAAFAGLLGVLPQLIYWKSVSGSFIYDVGSKWEFLNPHFRVLFGWEKGWFIYTPVTVFFIIGMFLMRRYPFRKSVLWFCLLNIYIIIAWHDWRYGGSYSTRALVQSYPLFALPFAALTDRVVSSKWRYGFYALVAYLLLVNLFQTNQYNTTVLHFNDMNRRYYARIYLNPSPSPVDMSLLDDDEVLDNEKGYTSNSVIQVAASKPLSFHAGEADTIGSTTIVQASHPSPSWLKISCTIRAPGCLWQSYLNATFVSGSEIKNCRMRLFNAISKDNADNRYVCYMRLPGNFETGRVSVYLTSPFTFNGVLDSLSVIQLDKIPD